MTLKNIIKRAFLSVLMFIILISSVPVTAFAVTQAEIDDIQKQKEELTAMREKSQERVDELKAEQASVLEQKAALDKRNWYALEQLSLIAEQIGLYDEMIADKAKEVDAARKKEEEQLERYRARVRAMEERGEYDLLSLISRVASLSDLLTLIDDIGEIMESDRRLGNEYVAAREETERVKAEYEEVKLTLDEKQAALKAEQVELEAQIEEAFLMIAELQNDIDKAIEEYEINEAAEEAMAAHFDEMSAQFAREQEEARQAAERAKQQAAQQAGSGGGSSESSGAGGGLESWGGSVSATGSFIWPVPSCTIITSRYGSRMHPILGYERFHAGLDIGAGAGSTIVAADGGTVSEARYSDSYGNYVLINHGNGYTTVCAHMSSIAVTEGQTVSQGDIIGYVGSTGWATGPHCHFEIRANGSTTDPAAFFSGLSYYDC